MKRIAILAMLASAVFLTGCAHMINITPPLNTISGEGITKVDKTVGYYISAADRAVTVTTPGGGGDEVSYHPYAEAEPALVQVLSNLYTKVVQVTALDDKATLANQNIAYVFTPVFTTTSKSTSMMTWPPTNFTLTIKCTAADASSKELWNTTVTGNGEAVFADFKHDFSLSARRASKDAFNQLQQKIAAAPELK